MGWQIERFGPRQRQSWMAYCMPTGYTEATYVQKKQAPRFSTMETASPTGSIAIENRDERQPHVPQESNRNLIFFYLASTRS